MVLTIKHYPDKKMPFLVLENENVGVTIGYLSKRGEKMLRQAFNCPNDKPLEIITLNNIFHRESED